MNLKTTGVWLLVAASLFAFIYFYQRHARNLNQEPLKVLPAFKASSAASISILPQGRDVEILVHRTNDGWQLTRPLEFPAASTAIEDLLSRLEQLLPATYISERELKNRANADQEYGFVNPQSSLTIQPGDYRLRFGKKTAPGDQVFLQIVGVEGIYVVDAALLKAIPQNANAWRDRTLIDLRDLAFDHIAVTNGPNIFVLQRDAPNQPWRLIYPGKDRADHSKIEESLAYLQHVRCEQFVSDDPKADLEALGLQPPQLEIGFAQATNSIALLQFGHVATNSPGEVYARQFGHHTIVTVSNEFLLPWRVQARDFRDPRLLAITNAVHSVEVRTEETFQLQHQGGNHWRMLPRNAAADPLIVKEFVNGLNNLQIVGFVKDFVTDPDLPAYGLATPARKYLLGAAAVTNAAGMVTNPTIVELHFGNQAEGKTFVRRTDESSVYAVNQADVQRLPVASWQLRSRQIWDCSEADVVTVTIRQRGKTRQILHQGPFKWSLAPGSQGIVEGLAEEETVRGLCHLEASAWVDRGQTNRARYGFADGGHQVTLELKNSQQMTVEFGGEAPSQFPYAATQIEGELWIFEFPLKLYRDVVRYLSIPENAP